MEGQPVPNLETSGHPIMTIGDEPPPAGFGYIGPSWQPRVSFAGTYDEAWQRSQAPYLPKDFDPQFLHAVAVDQIYPGRLQGGEPVQLIGASPVGVQRFAVPICDLAAEVHVAGAVERPTLHLETLLLEPDQDRFSMLWRGAVPCDKRVLKVEAAVVELMRLKGVAS